MAIVAAAVSPAFAADPELPSSDSRSANQIAAEQARERRVQRLCGSRFSDDRLRFRIAACDPVRLQASTESGSHVRIDSHGPDNRVDVSVDGPSRTTITQSGNGNSVSVTVVPATGGSDRRTGRRHRDGDNVPPTAGSDIRIESRSPLTVEQRR